MLNEKLKTSTTLSSENLNEIALAIGTNQSNFNEVFELLYDADFTIRSKAAKVIRKVASEHPDLVNKKKQELFKQLLLILLLKTLNLKIKKLTYYQ